MKRNEWTFQKTAAEIATGAENNANYHLKRIGFWEEQRDSIQHEIGESGLQVRPRAQSGGDRHEIVIDPEKMRRLSECEAKIEYHGHQADEYAQWYAHLKDIGGHFDLDHTDWVFFFGLKGDADE